MSNLQNEIFLEDQVQYWMDEGYPQEYAEEIALGIFEEQGV